MKTIAGLAVLSLGLALTGCPGDPAEPTVTITGDSSVEIGGTLQLSATTANLDGDSETYTWESADTSIATIDDTGLVTGVAAGETVITVTGADSGATDTHNVVVVPEDVTAEPVVTVTVPNFQLAVGDTVQATATTINGEDTGYTWTSSDEAVATVDANGLITAVAAGEAVITAMGDVTGATGEVGVVVLPADGITPEEVPFFTAWAGSAHADSQAEAFRHWDGEDPAEVPTSCAKCHTSQGFVDFAEDGSVDAAVPAEQVTGITCTACHSVAAQKLDSVIFPSGVTLTDVGAQARCWTCHQGRTSTQSVIDVIPAGSGEDDVLTDVRFQNIHYLAAAATLNGTLVQGGFQYDGKMYDARFQHVEGVDTCVSCHDPHSLNIQTELCATCHTGVATAEDARDIRMASSVYDYDGDGDTSEGIYGEVQTLREKLLAAIQTYAGNNANADDICFAPHSYPYWFIDTDASGGECDEAEATYANGYSTWTPALLKAAYNYQFGTKDPGGYAHNGKYVIELLFDSIEAMGGDVSGLTREDPGHFDGASEAFRHWDEDGDVSSSCSKCHGGSEGFHFYVEHGVSTEVPVAEVNGLQCGTCHADVEGTFALTTVDSFTLPSGVTITDYDAAGNICATCHSGRESGVDVDADIAAADFGFLNVHYLPAAGTLMGSEGHVGYEYAGNTYAGRWLHQNGGLQADNSCVFCHDPGKTGHTFEVSVATGCGCHSGVTTVEDIRFTDHAEDYDGDGSATEPLADEIAGLESELLDRIYAASVGLGNPICYGSSHPYWFKDTDSSGVVCDLTEQARSNSYDGWNAPLMRAAFNYQYSHKEPGAWAHNFDYMGQLLYDSIDALDPSATAGLVRP